MGAQCATSADVKNQITSGNKKRMMKMSLNKKVKNNEMLLESMVKLDVKFMSVLPSFLEGDSAKYTIWYEVFYGDTWDKWWEESTKSNYTSK